MIEVEVLEQSTVEVQVESELVPVGDYELYDGEYSVTPKFEEQKLHTKNLVMDNDMTVASIPIVTVSNPSGGNTIIIGG